MIILKKYRSFKTQFFHLSTKTTIILFFTLAVLFVAGYRASSQSNLIVLDDSALHPINISEYALVYEDPTGSKTLDDILDMAPESFVKTKSKVPNFGVTASTIWVKLRILQKSTSAFKLSINYPRLDSVRLYYPNQYTYASILHGWRTPDREANPKSPGLIFSLPPAPIDSIQTYYLKAKSLIVILPLYIGKSQAILDEQHKNALYYLFYLGLVAMLFFYNFSIFITSREIQYLYYSSWVFFVTLYFLIIKGYNRLIFPEDFNMIFRYTNIISSLGGISILLFVVQTLRLKEYLPRIIKWYTLLCSMYILIIISCLFQNFRLASNFSQLSLLLTVILGLISGIIMLRKGHSYSKYYVYGFVVTLITMSIYILIFQKLLPFNLFTSNAIVVGSGIEMILFSFGLGAKIHTINQEKQEAQQIAFNALKEKEQLIYQQNISLESNVADRTRELSIEKQKSEDLLLNILPAEVANELKRDGVSKARNYNDVTVLFTDFVNFTGISEILTPKELIKELHICFKGIDEVIERNSLEKIKTIGDAYLAVCGLPKSCAIHAVMAVQAAKEVVTFIENRKQNGGLFDIRIGIHSGPVIAGIVGTKKFAYDIWGDTVNTAARMEQHSEAGKINISGATWELVKHQFGSIHRGKIAAKNKGDIDMYYVV